MGNMFPGLSNKKKPTIVSLNAQVGLNDRSVKNYSKSFNSNDNISQILVSPSLFGTLTSLS
ncbi:hypothetical protein RB653_006181 [Dictyostelium firmibasis]|uniref:Uncharacterized protein n=1 Tax=Dictyostelium firmibasis TaxID=79012 RepID=A0AAN7UM90_9MYCE